MSRFRFPILWVLGGLLLAAIAAVGWHRHRGDVYRSELEEARRLSRSGRPYVALARWRALAQQYPGEGEIELQRALLAIRLKQDQEAEEALNRVPLDSPEAGPAGVLLGRGAMNEGNLTKAEAILSQAIRKPGAHTGEATRMLAGILTMEGRYQEAIRLLREQFTALPDPIDALREMHELDRGDLLVEKVRPLLTKASRHGTDHRIELGLAHLDLLEGNLDEADRRLTLCQSRNPNDQVVWRARLNWAIAAERSDAALQALENLEEGELDFLTFRRLEVWAAAREGQTQQEKDALDRLLSGAPADARALERLAELHQGEGHRQRAEELRRRKAEIDAARERYRDLIYRPNPVENARELSRIANMLGHPFEAHQWLVLAKQRPSPDSSADPSRSEKPISGPDSVASLCTRYRRLSKSRGTEEDRPKLVPQFVDACGQSGLRFRYDPGSSAVSTQQLPQAMGSGVALLDLDRDGWLDVYFTQGGTFPPSDNTPFQDRLFRNKGKGEFEDVTEKSGMSKFRGGYGLGVAAGDYDGDGDPDLFVTRWNAYALYRNRGDGTFEDVTTETGLSGPRDWPTSAAWGDLDGDGDLDLYVCHYLEWDPARMEVGKDASETSTLRTPLRFQAKSDHLFRNDDGRFVDVTEAAGIVDRDGRGLGVVIADLDGDHRPDIFVANDMTANFFFHNNGGMKFTESGHLAGLAANAEGGYQASMGVALGDQDGDGLIDLAVTNFYLESTTLYHNLGGGIFADHAHSSGLALPSRNRLGFGVTFLDADNDGHLDLASANGHLFDGLPGIPYQMPAQLLLGRRSGRFVDVTERAGPAWTTKRVGRALAAGDLDNDGRLDLVLVSLDSPALDLRNQTPSPGHFLTVELAGSGRNRDAVGAVVKVKAGGRSHVVTRFGGGSYQSSGDPRLHFGLGKSSRIEGVEVTWPSGKVESFENLTSDRGYRLREGTGIAESLPGFTR